MSDNERRMADMLDSMEIMLREVHELILVHTRACAECGARFLPYRKDSKYCCPQCTWNVAQRAATRRRRDSAA